jgi:hypothetical protein
VVVAAGLIIAVVAIGAILITSLARPADRIETGVVVAIDAVSLTNVRGFTLRTPDGRTVSFRIGSLENQAEFPPGHLTEHEATASPIRVTYRSEGTDLVAVRLEDATPAAASSAPPSAAPSAR